jgi:hypothetical protein
MGQRTRTVTVGIGPLHTAYSSMSTTEALQAVREGRKKAKKANSAAYLMVPEPAYLRKSC